MYELCQLVEVVTKAEQRSLIVGTRSIGLYIPNCQVVLL